MTDRTWIDRLISLANVAPSDEMGDRLTDLVRDTVAVAAGARRRRTGAAGLDRVAIGPLPAGAAHVWGGGETTAPMQAAFLNGTSAEALDYQEVLIDGRNNGHAAVVIVPALLALAQDRGVAGPRLSGSLNVAFTANLMLMRALGRGHRAGAIGFRTTALGAPIAAALAGAHLIGLDPDRIAHATAIAACSLPAGLLAAMSPLNGSYSSDKDTAVGLSAQYAVQSVLLAEAGATGPTTPLTGHRGWLASFGFGTAEPEVLDLPPPVDAAAAYALKRYPANFGCQAAIRAALTVREHVAPGDIANVRIRVKTSSAQSLATKSIVNHLAARFSLAYSVASALVRGRCVLADFEQPALGNAAVLDLIDRCTIHGDAALEAIHHERGVFPGQVTVRHVDGSEFTAGFEGPWDGADESERSAGLAEKMHDLLGECADQVTRDLGRIGTTEGFGALTSALEALSHRSAVVGTQPICKHGEPTR